MNRLMKCYLILLTVIFLGYSCKSGKVEAENIVENQSVEETQEWDQSCYDNRKKIKDISDVEGMVKTMARFQVIQVGDSKRYQPCSLPENYKDGDRVLFSGEIKEIFRNERRAGRPIVISKINILN